MPISMLTAAIALFLPGPTEGPELGVVDVRLADSKTVVIHFRDGYVRHHELGKSRSEETVILAFPLNTAMAATPDLYSVSSNDDPKFAKPIHPEKIYRKTKGTDFAWFADSWSNGRAVNNRPDFAAEHWLYLTLPHPFKEGKLYRIQSPSLRFDLPLKLDPQKALSDSIHVNLLGYRPDAPQKFGYVYAWMGDGGSLEGKKLADLNFQIIDTATNKPVLSGKTKFRAGSTQPETSNLNDTPNGNFLGADVAECDFTDLRSPGHYFLHVDGIGRSQAFEVRPDVYTPAFRAVMQGILGNRSGIELGPPYVPYHRPAPHNATLTPGFAGKLKYSTSRYLDRKNPDYSGEDRAAVEQGIKGDLEASGWYQDAGDWDSYSSHIQVPERLMLAYQLNPKALGKLDFPLPGAHKGLPSILEEARWLIDFCYRLRHELLIKKFGSGGIGLRICGDHFGSDTGPKDVGRGSWQDVDRIWTASGEDPVSTYGYAGIAAQFAICLQIQGIPDPEGVDWTREASESFKWAEAHSLPGDKDKPDYKEYRTYALAGLALLSKDDFYSYLLKTATKDMNSATRLWWSVLDGPALYLITQSSNRDEALTTRFREALLATADFELESSRKRARRWGGDWGMPMLIGQQTTPWVEAMAAAYVVTRETDRAKSEAYFSAVLTTADYFLGTNPLNQTWVSGLGPASPRNVFHMDGWYEDGPQPHPGIVPYGPWQKGANQGAGPWDHDWANKSVYPAIDAWPGAERWFENRCSPMTNEFTIWQNLAPSAFTYGFLLALPK